MSTDCLFCKILAGEIPAERVYEDEHVIVIPDINPQADVHLLMIPRQHVASLAEAGPEHDALLAHMLRVLPEVAGRQGLTGFKTVINTGKAGGQVIFHLHAHLLGGTIRAIV
jgi:histidine triad (HIT) family protein